MPTLHTLCCLVRLWSLNHGAPGHGSVVYRRFHQSQRQDVSCIAFDLLTANPLKPWHLTCMAFVLLFSPAHGVFIPLTYHKPILEECIVGWDYEKSLTFALSWQAFYSSFHHLLCDLFYFGAFSKPFANQPLSKLERRKQMENENMLVYLYNLRFPAGVNKFRPINRFKSKPCSQLNKTFNLCFSFSWQKKM